jgi:tRNA-Thr(GGU) m(6)t(6)A37 methyltransferase TsaA
MKFDVTPIAFTRSCYKEKFATPRQPGLVSAATGIIEFTPPFNDPDCIAGLEECSHIWLHFIFHQCIDQGWKAKVRPPRLGGNKKMGVFATRATHRPNALGMSVVKLDRVDITQGNVALHVSGLDLIDGTPIIDIKPYIPYSDSIEQAVYPFAQTAPKSIPVIFSKVAQAALSNNQSLQTLIIQVLSQDPKPAFHKIDNSRIYGAKLEDMNVTWIYDIKDNEEIIEVKTVEPV